MPRFYFHFRTHDGLSQDEDGLDLPDLETAYLEAFRAAKDVWVESLHTGQDPTRHVFEIRDGSGALLLEVPVCEVLRTQGARPEPA